MPLIDTIKMAMSRDINELEPHVAQLCHKFVAECAKQGITVIVTSTYRSDAEQAALYAIGRTKPGNRVTNAKPGQSMHQFKVAFDFVPIIHGKAVWNNASLFIKCGIIGEKLGLEWCGRWKLFRESCHLQFCGGLTLADFQAGKKLVA
jgi:peptidoglycan L-alanyl-D-glutamate endopeptidase CwlK